MGYSAKVFNFLGYWEVDANIGKDKVEEEFSEDLECLVILKKVSIWICGWGSTRKTPDIFKHIKSHFYVLLDVWIEKQPDMISWKSLWFELICYGVRCDPIAIDSNTPWLDKEIPKPFKDMFIVLVACKIIITYKEIKKAEMLEEVKERWLQRQFTLEGEIDKCWTIASFSIRCKWDDADVCLSFKLLMPLSTFLISSTCCCPISRLQSPDTRTGQTVYRQLSLHKRPTVAIVALK